jgi:hypothetical protein
LQIPVKDALPEAGGTVMQNINSVPLIVRREIEALIAAPLIKAYIEKFGREATLEVTRKVIKSLAEQAGKALQMTAGGNGIEELLKAWSLFSQGGALEFDVLEATPAKASLNMTRCKYAEMYKEPGLEEFGFLLSCGRDFALMEGFNPTSGLPEHRLLWKAECTRLCPNTRPRAFPWHSRHPMVTSRHFCCAERAEHTRRKWKSNFR